MALPILFGPKAAKQIDNAIRKVGGTIQNPTPAPRARWQKKGMKRGVILDQPLPAASNAKTAPSSARATALDWDGEAYTETEEEVIVWNHSESQSYLPDTFGYAEVIDGHEVFIGDCDAMRDR
jgi:hypothetical protein